MLQPRGVKARNGGHCSLSEGLGGLLKGVSVEADRGSGSRVAIYTVIVYTYFYIT